MPAGAGGCGRSAAPSGAARAAAGGMPAPREPVMLARGRHACARLGQPAVRVRQGPRTCFSGAPLPRRPGPAGRRPGPAGPAGPRQGVRGRGRGRRGKGGAAAKKKSRRLGHAPVKPRESLHHEEIVACLLLGALFARPGTLDTASAETAAALRERAGGGALERHGERHSAKTSFANALSTLFAALPIPGMPFESTEIERSVRGIVVVFKRLHRQIRCEEGADMASIEMSLYATCKKHGIEPPEAVLRMLRDSRWTPFKGPPEPPPALPRALPAMSAACRAGGLWRPRASPRAALPRPSRPPRPVRYAAAASPTPRRHFCPGSLASLSPSSSALSSASAPSGPPCGRRPGTVVPARRIVQHHPILIHAAPALPLSPRRTVASARPRSAAVIPIHVGLRPESVPAPCAPLATPAA